MLIVNSEVLIRHTNLYVLLLSKLEPPILVNTPLGMVNYLY